MSKRNIIVNIFIIIIAIFSFIKSEDFINRHDGYNNIYDCLENPEKGKDEIASADDCFKKSPLRKWKCCYYEMWEGGKMAEKGCMKVRKNNETDLNDLKDFVSQRGIDTVFTCEQNYLYFSFGAFILLLLFSF